MTERKPQEQDKFILRLPPGMRQKIRYLAERNNRSMNAEILMALDLWLGPDSEPPDLETLTPPPDLVSKQEIVALVRDAVDQALKAYQQARGDAAS
jgi:hypothetical protein